MSTSNGAMEVSAPKSSEELGHDSCIEAPKASAGHSSEYEEYLDLKREFEGERLTKLLRKVE